MLFVSFIFSKTLKVNKTKMVIYPKSSQVIETFLMSGLLLGCGFPPLISRALSQINMEQANRLMRICLELQEGLEESFLLPDQVIAVAQELRRRELLVPNFCCPALETPADLPA